MPTAVYTWNKSEDLLSQIEVAPNSFGREDAVIYPNKSIANGQFKDLPLKLEKHGITAYPDIRDGQQVLVAYGFKKADKLVDILKRENLVSEKIAPKIKINDNEKNERTGQIKKFVRRYAIRLAAVSGLLGHISMGSISALTKDWKFFGTAWKYTAADAVIATYGTDKSVTADPVMQDFKNYLWSQGVENDFVKARTDEVSGAEGFNNFMKKRSFQIANAFGAMGNLNQIQIGLEDKNTGFVVAGATSMFGAGLQIFGSEKKQNPEQLERKGIFSKVFSFIDANPMQIAAATNFTDPFALFYSAYNNTKIEANNKANNNAELKKHYSILGSKNFATRDLFTNNSGTALTTQKNFLEASNIAEELHKEHAKKSNFFKRFTDPFDKDKAAKLETDFNDKYSKLQGENGLDSNGQPAENFAKNFKSADTQAAAKSVLKIGNLQESNAKIDRGGKLKTALLYLVATFYTGATLLRFVAKKTASAEENKDAFNEVYAAAAESLLNIKDVTKREEMTLQMGHYLSTHPKISEPAEKIITALRERVNSFNDSPFIDSPIAPAPIASIETVKEVTSKPVPETSKWTDKTQNHESHEQLVETKRLLAEKQAQQPHIS